MNRRFPFGLVVAVVLLLGALGIGLIAYNIGIAQGLAQGVHVVAPETPGTPLPYYGGPFFYPRPFGFGFGLFGFLFVIFFLFLVFAVLRRLFWRGWMGGRGFGGGPAHWDRDRDTSGLPPMFEEWHRRAHAQESGQQTGADKPQS
jgi:hypothetical protein